MIRIPLEVERAPAEGIFAEQLADAMHNAEKAFLPTCIGASWNRNWAWNRLLPTGSRMNASEYHFLHGEPLADGRSFQGFFEQDEPWSAIRGLNFDMDDLIHHCVTRRQDSGLEPADAFILRRRSLLMLISSTVDFGDRAILMLPAGLSGHDIIEEAEAVKQDFATLLDVQPMA